MRLSHVCYTVDVVICSRCTGYRPILDAFRVFAKADPKAYTEEAIAAAKGLASHTDATAAPVTLNGGSICPSSGMPCDCRSNEMNGCGGGGTNGKMSNGHCATDGCNGSHEAANGKVCGAGACGKCSGTGMLPATKTTKEPIFPPELKTRMSASR
jgi:xanthine dehydrogenase/oxidase